MLGFKKRAIQVTFPEVPKDTWNLQPAQGSASTEINEARVENMYRFGKDFVTHTAVTIGLVYSGMRVVNSVCKIVEIAAKAKLK